MSFTVPEMSWAEDPLPTAAVYVDAPRRPRRKVPMRGESEDGIASGELMRRSPIQLALNALRQRVR